jgi:hypothetical protein
MDSTAAFPSSMQAKLVDEDLKYWEPPYSVLPAPSEGKMIAITVGTVKLFLRPSLAGGIAWATAEASVSAVEVSDEPMSIDGASTAPPMPVGSRALTGKKLIMRTEESSESEKVCDAPAGATVIVLEATPTRVKIALGDVAASRGWVTILGKDGMPNLTVVEEEAAPDDEYFLTMAFPEDAPAAAAVVVVVEGVPADEKESPSKTKDKDGGNETARKNKAKGKVTPRKAEATPRKVGGKAAGGGSADKAAGGGAKKATRKPIGTKGGKDAKAADEGGMIEKEVIVDPWLLYELLPSEELMAARAEKLAASAELIAHAEAGASSSTLERQLGGAIVARGGDKDGLKKGEWVASLMREWDKNGDKLISKGEFRQAVRSSFQIKADNSSIEALFDSLDSDGGGTLDLQEIKNALQKLAEAADAATKEDEVERQKGLAAGAIAKALLPAIQATAAFVRTEEELAVHQAKEPMDAALGEALGAKIRKGTTLDLVIKEWDKDGSGHVDKAEFVQNALALLEKDRSDAEVMSDLDALFESMMVHQGMHDGKMHHDTLDVQALRRLLDAAKARQGEEERLTNKCANLRKAAAKLQAAVQRT